MVPPRLFPGGHSLGFLGFSAGSLGFWPGFSRISRILGIVAWTTPQAQRHSLDLRGDAALGITLCFLIILNRNWKYKGQRTDRKCVHRPWPTHRGERGVWKNISGRDGHRGGGVETRHAKLPTCTCLLYFQLRFYFSMQNCSLLHSVTLQFLLLWF